MNRKLNLKLMIMLVSGFLLFTGCSAQQEGSYTREQLGNLAKIEIYTAKDDTLLKTITDEETIYRYNQCELFENLDIEERQEELKESAENTAEAYYFVSYKYSAARFSRQETEKNTTITLYENSNMVKMTVSEDSIKAFSLPQEFLTFYYEVSDEDMAFYHSLIDG